MTYPKCSREGCRRVAMGLPEHTLDDPDLGISWPKDLCGVHIDIEYACNVSKDLWGTKSLAYYVAVEEGLDEAAEELRR